MLEAYWTSTEVQVPGRTPFLRFFDQLCTGRTTRIVEISAGLVTHSRRWSAPSLPFSCVDARKSNRYCIRHFYCCSYFFNFIRSHLVQKLRWIAHKHGSGAAQRQDTLCSQDANIHHKSSDKKRCPLRNRLERSLPFCPRTLKTQQKSFSDMPMTRSRRGPAGNEPYGKKDFIFREDHSCTIFKFKL